MRTEECAVPVLKLRLGTKVGEYHIGLWSSLVAV